MDTTTASIPDHSADQSSVPSQPSHPNERALSRFAVNEMGLQGKKVILRHLEACPECRQRVTTIREISRRYRDLERRAIAHVASQIEP